MAKLVTVQKDALTALYEWLVTRLSPAGITFMDDWPEPSVPLANRRVTILAVGAPQDESTDPVLVGKVSEAAPGVPAVYRWRAAVRRQNVQLECWATNQPDIQDVAARLEPELRRGEMPLGTLFADPVSNVLVLNLSAEHANAVAQFSFEGPEFTETPNRIQEQEYRATIMGIVDVVLTVDAPSYTLASVILRQYSYPKPTHGKRDVTTVTQTSVSHTQETY